MLWKRRKQHKKEQVSLSEKKGLGRSVGRDCMEVEDEAECRRKLDEQRKKTQKELRDVDSLSWVSKEMHKSLKESVQHQLPGQKEKFAERESLAAKEEMRKLREEIECKEERFSLLADKVDKNRMADAEMEAELQGLQTGEERSGRGASKAVDCCLVTTVEHVFAVGTDQARSTFDALCKIFVSRFETPILPAQMPGREEGRRDSEMNKSKAEPVSSWCYPRQAGSVKMHQRVVWSLIFLVYGGFLVKAEVQE